MGPNIAIVGGGIGGASAAYHLRRQLPSAQLTVFEREPVVGGRSRRIEFAGHELDLGAMSTPLSERLAELAGATGQKLLPQPLASAGLWNGSRFHVTTRAHRAAVSAALMRHYGTTSPVVTTRFVRRTLAKWDKLAHLQRQGRSFITVAGLLDAINLTPVTAVSLRHSLGSAGASSDFMAIAGAACRSLYAQDVNLGGMAGVLALAETGFTGQKRWRAAGGWPELCRQIFDWADAEVIHEKVTRVESKDPARDVMRSGPDLRPGTPDIRPGTPGVPSPHSLRGGPAAADPASGKSATSRSPKSSRLLGTSGTAKGRPTGEGLIPTGPLTVVTKDERQDFDAVLITTPLESADIKLSCHRRLVRPPLQTYLGIHITLVQGHLDPGYFGLTRDDAIPQTIFAAASPKTSFASLSRLSEDCYRLTTLERPLSDDAIERLFSSTGQVHRHIWRAAYPQFTPGAPAADFVLAPGIYYSAGLETIAANLEMAAAAGQNLALLACQQVE